MNRTAKKTTRQIALIAVLIAMEVVLSRFLSFSVWNLKLGLSFIPVMLAAYLVGPVGGLIVGGMSDFIGAVLFPIGTYFPGFTVTAALTGLIFGLFIYKNCNIIKIVLSVVITQVVCGLILNTWCISFLYSSPYMPLFVTRLAQVGVMSVLEIVFGELIFDRIKVLDKIKLT